MCAARRGSRCALVYFIDLSPTLAIPTFVCHWPLFLEKIGRWDLLAEMSNLNFACLRTIPTLNTPQTEEYAPSMAPAIIGFA